MPELDPSRHVEMILADPSHHLPLPDRGGRIFLAEGEVVDIHHPFYAPLIADGSIKPKPPAAASAETEGAKVEETETPKTARDPGPGLAVKAASLPVPKADPQP